MLHNSQILGGWQGEWLQKSSILCRNSVNIYGINVTYKWGLFALQGCRNLFGELKKILI